MPFAEIEYGDDSNTPSTGQKISHSIDPIREKFFDMRSIAPTNSTMWVDPKLFYRQGKFMEDFTDNYTAYESLNIYYPSYQRLGYGQLRTYFSWRTHYRNGLVGDIALSYVFLHVYETINLIGQPCPASALQHLVQLWMDYRGSHPSLDDYLPAVVWDFHVYYRLDTSFVDFVASVNGTGIRQYFAKYLIFTPSAQHSLRDWESMCKFKVYKPATEKLEVIPLLELMMCHVIRDIKVLPQLFYFNVAKGPLDFWEPFHGNVFYEDMAKMPAQEIVLDAHPPYYYRFGQMWQFRRVIPVKLMEKYMDFFLRVVYQYGVEINKGGKVAPPHVPPPHVPPKVNLDIAEALAEQAGTSIAGILGEIWEIGLAAYREMHHVDVKVNLKNITRIRTEADITQEKLIVEEEVPVVVPVVAPPPVVMPVVADDNPYQGLWEAFTDVEKNIITMAINTPDAVAGYIKENNTMLELVADGINEKAMDVIGDNLLETISATLEIYPDYLMELEGVINANT